MYTALFLACTDGDVRLVGGVVKTEGTVEVCSKSLWGAIAAEGWTAIDAAVVCNQLGYPSQGIHNNYADKIIHNFKNIHCSN